MKPPCNERSARVRETKESTTGGALGTTQGSCRPFILKIVAFFDLMSTVTCFFAIEDAGLNATRITIGIPVESPPRIPPALFVFVTILPFLIMYRSLFSEPKLLDPLKPDPNSIQLTDGIENIALLISDSIDLKIGSPIPVGKLKVTDSIIPPNESPFFRASIMEFFIFFA